MNFHSGRTPALPCAGAIDEKDEKDSLERWFDDSTDDSDSECDNEPKKSVLEMIENEI